MKNPGVGRVEFLPGSHDRQDEGGLVGIVAAADAGKQVLEALTGVEIFEFWAHVIALSLSVSQLFNFSPISAYNATLSVGLSV